MNAPWDFSLSTVRSVERPLGVMVNYTARVQHTRKGAEIALSTGGKMAIEHEHGPKVRRRATSPR